MHHDEALQRAREWVAAWNAHDLDRILAHYAEEIEFVSPFAVRLAGAADGTVRGKAALREYFARALQAYPALQFRLHFVCASVRSFTAVYESVNGLQAAEVFELNEEGMACRVLAHYAPGR
jgi:ketosteroid isomerase-like protein